MNVASGNEPLARFLDAHRNVSIDVDLSERTVGLLDEGYDLALRLGELLDSGLVSRCLGCFALEVVASPAYVATHGRPRRMRDLRNHEALIYTQTAQPERWCFFGPDQRAETIEVRGRFRASDIGILIELALGGHGLLLAPSFLVNRPLSEGRLVAVLDSWRARDLPLSVLLPHRLFVPAAVRALVAFLASWFDARASENVDQ